jgi:hypothetical protein
VKLMAIESSPVIGGYGTTTPHLDENPQKPVQVKR